METQTLHQRALQKVDETIEFLFSLQRKGIRIPFLVNLERIKENPESYYTYEIEYVVSWTQERGNLLERIDYNQKNYAVEGWTWVEISMVLHLQNDARHEISAHISEGELHCYYDGREFGHNCSCPPEVALAVICAWKRIPVPKILSEKEKQELLVAADALEAIGYNFQADLFRENLGLK